MTLNKHENIELIKIKREKRYFDWDRTWDHRVKDLIAVAETKVALVESEVEADAEAEAEAELFLLRSYLYYFSKAANGYYPKTMIQYSIQVFNYQLIIYTVVNRNVSKPFFFCFFLFSSWPFLPVRVNTFRF